MEAILASERGRIARGIVCRLRDAGHEAYLAGGCVRDLLLGREPHDYDVATSARPAEIAVLFERTVPVGAAFGVMLAVVGGENYEIATFRADGPYSDGRHPTSVTFSGAREDALRRDFTINGIFLDPDTGEILDHVDGQADLDRRVIRAIGDPGARFREDRLRLLRAVRFACSLDFEIDPATRETIVEEASEIRVVSSERVRDELSRILVSGGAARGFRLLEETGLLAVVLPEVAAMVGVEQPPDYHPEGDVWEHTLRVLEGIDRMATEDRSPELAFAALLHDVGKPVTFSESDRIRFNDHARVGAEMTEAICRRLHMSRAEITRIVDLVAHHMRFMDVTRMRPARLIRFLGRDDIQDQLSLHRVDCEASHGGLDNHDFCRNRLEELRRQPPPAPRLVTGHDLLAEGFERGPRIGAILREVEDAQLEGRLTTRDEALAYVRRHHPRSPAGEDDPPTL